MGRTVRTVRDAILIEEAKWKPFRRQLKGKNRERVEQIFDAARTYADAGSMAVRLHTPDLLYMCALLSLMERIDQLESELEEMKASSTTQP